MTFDPSGVDLHEVLQRPPLPIDEGALARAYAGRRVLVTGAAGSIGACLAAKLRDWGVAELVLLDNHEPSLYDLKGRLGAAPQVVYHLADVRHARKVARLIAAHRPDVLFHLAAYKHVPLGEENPDEAFAANVLGALNIARAAADAGVATLVYPSTDKAVYPPSVYGATKRIVELLLRAFAAEMGAPRCSIVRLVNAVGAQGGVIRVFARQIAEGHALTMTHEGMTRYWISMDEAALLVAQAGCLAPDVEVIVPNVGPAMRLTDVAQRLIDLLRPGADVPVTFTGMRPGERLTEFLNRDDEYLEPCAHAGVLAVRGGANAFPPLGAVLTAIGKIEELREVGDVDGLRRAIFALVGA